MTTKFLPPIFPNMDMIHNASSNTQIVLSVLSGMLFVAMAILIGWSLIKVMERNKFAVNRKLIIILMAVFSIALVLRYGMGIQTYQGLFLLIALIFASGSDIKFHAVDNFIWVVIIALSLVSIPTVGLASMLTGALLVFIPQIALAILPPHKTMGGADIKISTAIAFLLGGWRGVCASLIALLVAVIVMSIRNKIKGKEQNAVFPYVPFIGIGAMVMFLV